MNYLYSKLIVPWRLKELQRKSKNSFFFFLGKFLNLNKNQGKKIIFFYVTFDGMTGGSQAIANLAVLLSGDYQVYFKTNIYSNYNPILFNKVILTRRIPDETMLVICDDSTSAEAISNLRKRLGVPIVVSCHCQKHSGHGLKPVEIVSTLQSADKVHFVNQCQQKSFQLSKDSYFIIPNYCKRVQKSNDTQNIGAVGNLNNPQKRAHITVDIGLKSNCTRIHLWRSDDHTLCRDSRVVLHKEWEQSKNKIYASFDVLVFFSETETFGLTIIEAMSAGIPCVLSDIAAFQQYRSCEGITLLSPQNISHAEVIVNKYLANKSLYADSLIAHWRSNYSTEEVLKLWKKILHQLIQTNELT